MILRPFFSFFGGKWSLSKYYPRPEHDDVIEPFAGSAGYATRFADRRVTLVETEPVIAGIWRYLIASSSAEILRLPAVIEDVEEISAPQEARWLIGFWISRGASTPRRTPSSWARDGRWPECFWGEKIRARVARQVEHIRHWKLIEGDFTKAPNVEATWLIDPPYVSEGNHYRHHKIDYPALAKWTRARRGLAIACEADGADWLPFTPFRTIKSLARSTARESIYVQRRAAADDAPQRWAVSWRADPKACDVADRHYNRQKIGAPQFVPPGRCLVLATRGHGALWVTSWPFAEYVKHRWPGAWINSLFRNETREHLSSDLIRDAVAATRAAYGAPPALGMVTFVDADKVKKKRDPGHCYLRAGFKRPPCPECGGFTVRIGPKCGVCIDGKARTKAGLLVFQMMPADMPPARAAAGAQLPLCGLG